MFLLGFNRLSCMDMCEWCHWQVCNFPLFISSHFSRRKYLFCVFFQHRTHRAKVPTPCESWIKWFWWRTCERKDLFSHITTAWVGKLGTRWPLILNPRGEISNGVGGGWGLGCVRHIPGSIVCPPQSSKAIQVRKMRQKWNQNLVSSTAPGLPHAHTLQPDA